MLKNSISPPRCYHFWPSMFPYSMLTSFPPQYSIRLLKFDFVYFLRTRHCWFFRLWFRALVLALNRITMSGAKSKIIRICVSFITKMTLRSNLVKLTEIVIGDFIRLFRLSHVFRPFTSEYASKSMSARLTPRRMAPVSMSPMSIEPHPLPFSSLCFNLIGRELWTARLNWEQARRHLSWLEFLWFWAQNTEDKKPKRETLLTNFYSTYKLYFEFDFEDLYELITDN